MFVLVKVLLLNLVVVRYRFNGCEVCAVFLNTGQSFILRNAHLLDARSFCDGSLWFVVISWGRRIVVVWLHAVLSALLLVTMSGCLVLNCKLLEHGVGVGTTLGHLVLLGVVDRH